MLYRFCVKNKIVYSVCENKLNWDTAIDDPAFEVLKVLFGGVLNGDKIPKNSGEAKLSHYSTIPFVFHILHKDSEFRSLSIPHPALQIGMTEFYNRNKDLILHYCRKSNYSLRYPSSVASYFFYRDQLHSKLLGGKQDNIELFFNEYENLKTFFSYKDFTQIYRFYNDYRFQRYEKRFAHLCKFDIQRCFDSIYTHTIAWATLGGKNAYKQTFRGSDKETFGAQFDAIMQRLNYNETNGIVIGPEFSRIFAEIILQHIDANVEYKLSTDNNGIGNQSGGLVNGEDYKVCRYVDDYFLFYNAPEVKDKVVEAFQKELEVYKLRIGSEKTQLFDRPFITDISRAKIKIDSIISDWFKYRTERNFGTEDQLESDEIKDTVDENNEPSSEQVKCKIKEIIGEDGYFPLVAKKFNIEFKDIISTTNVKPKDIINYTLSCVYTRVVRELKKFEDKYKYINIAVSKAEFDDSEIKNECVKYLAKARCQLTKFLTNVIDTTFYLFSLCRRLNSTLKVMRILNVIIVYLTGECKYKNDKNRRFSAEIKNAVFDQIYIEILNILEREKCHDYAQLEVLYLLIVLKLIQSRHAIDPNVLKSYLRLDGTFHLNAIAICVLLYYIGNKQIYSELKIDLLEHIHQKFKAKGNYKFTKDCECITLALDLACCPYLSEQQKREILADIELTASADKILEFAEHNKYMFVKWKGVNVTKELAAKISQEVYS
jgi:hypothetical protein